MSESSFEELRLSYKPDRIQVLFVGESPPVGGTFFYRGNSNLARYTQEAFSTAFGTAFATEEEFLDHFRCSGCYLDDLCLIPVNHLSKTERRREWKRGMAPLAGRIANIRPRAVVVVMRGIAGHVERAGLTGVPVYPLPFPAMGHQGQYVSELAKALCELRAKGMLTPFPLCLD